MAYSILNNRKLQIFFPYILSLLLAIPCWILLPDYFPTYRARLIESGFIDKPGGYEYYKDLNQDGFSERIIVFNNTQNEASVKIINYDGSIGDHYYFRGQILKQSLSCFFNDYDRSGSTRIILFTIKNDSLLLHCVDPIRKKAVEFHSKYIASVVPKNGSYDVGITPTFFSDMDGDGINEFITTILAGFPLKPRIGMILDFDRDTLIMSQDRGMFFYILTFRDIDGDGQQELFPVDYSIWNYPDSADGEISDHKARLAVFDNQLRFRFPPVEFPGRYIRIYTCPIKSATGDFRLFSLICQKISGSDPPRIRLSDISGNLLKERELHRIPGSNEHTLLCFDEFPDRVFILNTRGGMEVVDGELNVLRSIRLDESLAGHSGSIDTDHDGIQEHVFFTGSRRIPTIFRNDFSHPVRLEGSFTSDPCLFGLQQRGTDAPRIFIQQGNDYYLYIYGRNPVFFLKYPFYIAIYLTFLAIILLSLYIQRILIKQRIDAQKKIVALQLLVLNNQIDPHFTFNAISSISASILQDRPDEANRNLLALSWLMRSCVSHSEKLSRALGEELSFVNHYLDLMKTRMNGGFDYLIEVAPEVDISWEVPKMGIQIYAENAVKHGLRPKGAGGKLVISVGTTAPPHPGHVASLLATSFTICIEDNGIGRKQARLTGEAGTGHGLQMMEQFYATFNRYSKEKIRCGITDLEDEAGNPLGTRVEITIPVGMKYTV